MAKALGSIPVPQKKGDPLVAKAEVSTLRWGCLLLGETLTGYRWMQTGPEAGGCCLQQLEMPGLLGLWAGVARKHMCVCEVVFSVQICSCFHHLPPCQACDSQVEPEPGNCMQPVRGQDLSAEHSAPW